MYLSFFLTAKCGFFGSRDNGTAKHYSDLDLALVGQGRLDWRRLAELKETFQESDLSFRVDLLDWNAISAEFRNVIETSGYEALCVNIDVASTKEANYEIFPSSEVKYSEKSLAA